MGLPSQEHPDYYAEVYDFGALEAAFEAAYMYLDNAPDDCDAEEWLMNLHNHLVWRSYKAGENPDMDVVVLEAIRAVLKRHSIRAEDAGLEVKFIVDILTLA